MPSADRAPRRGAVLLVVLVMLALFAALGITFVLYSQSQGEMERVRRDLTSIPEYPPPPTGAATPASLVSGADAAAQRFLGQFLYDVSDTDSSDAQSGVRGHSLARTMYGYNLNRPAGNTAPYSGRGPIPQADQNNGPLPALSNATFVPAGAGTFTRDAVVNYAYMPGQPILDPEWTSYRPATAASIGDASSMKAAPVAGTDRLFFPLSAPYTAPDRKDLFLAKLNPAANGSAFAAERVVVEPSFHRYGAGDANAFNAAEANVERRLAPPAGTPGALVTSSATPNDWTDSVGRLKILRPRPADHRYPSTAAGTEDFPYPPPNPDGSVTGDVQNFPNAAGIQRNDSLWLYPAVDLSSGAITSKWNNKFYAALVAPLVIDLGGRVDLDVAGNLKGDDGTTAAVAHASSQGVGPWEVNPRWVFDPSAAAAGPNAASLTALQQLVGKGAKFNSGGGAGAADVGGRYGYSGAAALTPPQDSYSLTNNLDVIFRRPTPPYYSRFDADGAGAVGSGDRATLTGNSTDGTLSPFPNFATTRYYDENTGRRNAELANHPGQYAPGRYADTFLGGAKRTAPVADVRRIAGQGAGRVDGLAQANAMKILPQQLLAAGRTYDPNKAPNSPNSYGPTTNWADPNFNPAQPNLVGAGDPTNLIRMLTTTYSASTRRATVELKDAAGTGVLARLGPVDLSRALPDYRQGWKPDAPDADATNDSTTARWKPEADSPAATAVTPAQSNLALKARQDLARDIFVRLVAVEDERRRVAGGTRLITAGGVSGYNPSTRKFTVPTVGLSAPLKPFAQLAVNMVDAVDNDDVATVFLFDDFYADITAVPVASAFDSVVIGTELPRLVVNEVYASAVNDRNDPQLDMTTMMMVAKEPVRSRFWVELYNPMYDDAATPQRGRARLAYNVSTDPTLPASFAVYQIILSPASKLNDLLTRFGPAAGAVGLGSESAVNGQAFADLAAQTGSKAMMDDANFVRPAGGSADGSSGTFNAGYFVVGPENTQPINHPDTGGTDADVSLRLKYQAAGGGNLPKGMELVSGTGAPATGDITGATNPHVVALRRLANPYLEPNENPADATAAKPYNPYVTVDVSAPVKPRDRVKYDNMGTRNSNQVPTGGTDPDPNGSYGRRHPYSAGGIAVTPSTGTGGAVPPTTFFKKNNGYETTPRWLQHLDRAPLNPLELANVSAFGPGELTQEFLAWEDAWNPSSPPATQSVTASEAHSAARYLLPGLPTRSGTMGVTVGNSTKYPPTLSDGANQGFLLPALDLLDVRLPQSGTAVGAPVHGRINVNGITHKSVANALFDPPVTGATNPSNAFLSTDVDNAYSKVIQQTAATPVYGTVNATSPANTLFRLDTLAMPQTCAVYPAAVATEAEQHVSSITEMARKIWQSHSTTSDAFLVVLTVGFFEVRNVDSAGKLLKADGTLETVPENRRLFLGKELFAQVPGDCRVRFAAVVDRSQLAMVLEGNTAANTPPTLPTDRCGQVKDSVTASATLEPAQAAPWFTSVEKDSPTPPNHAASTADDPPFTLVVRGTYVSPTQFKVFRNGEEVTVDTTKTGATATDKLQAPVIHIGFGDAADLGEGASYLVGSSGAIPAVQQVAEPDRYDETPSVPPAGLMRNGVVRLNLYPLTKPSGGTYRWQFPHPPGSVVTNALPGNPGPAAGKAFQRSTPAGRAVVPFFQQLQTGTVP